MNLTRCCQSKEEIQAWTCMCEYLFWGWSQDGASWFVFRCRAEESKAERLRSFKWGGEGVVKCWKNHLMRHEGRAGSCRAITFPQVATAASWLNGVGDPVAELWWQSDYHNRTGPLSTLGAPGLCWEKKTKKQKKKLGRKVKSKHNWYLLLPWGVIAFASESTKYAALVLWPKSSG